VEDAGCRWTWGTLFHEPAERDLCAAEAEQDRLYQQIERLPVELEWFKNFSMYFKQDVFCLPG
jgi:hypothetical protein